METLNYTTKEINSTFKIKVNDLNQEGKKVNMLVGVSGAVAIIGVAMFNKLLDRAFSCTDDCCYCKLRRGVKFSFYYY